MLKFLLIAFLILFIILKNHRRQATQTYSLQTFLISSSDDLLEDKQNEQKKSLIEKINDYLFKDSDNEMINDDNEDIGDGGDGAGE
ncbi:hypothetical protein [Bacillus tuaregi]|uniref:hypothetical protein n=1 Tax=Bacillus tuaregi TaxID=1816695 RepID=UPI0008F8B22A|nr:hypothetical protein [Bacillus tuaregi]